MTIDEAVAENEKLLLVLDRVIPWIGVSPDGPAWATQEAKERNRSMCEEAFMAATNCFPEFHCGARNETVSCGAIDFAERQ
jgi:hypothetical protein